MRNMTSTIVNMFGGIGITTMALITTGLGITSLFKWFYYKRQISNQEESVDELFNIDPILNTDDSMSDTEMIILEKMQKNALNDKYADCLIKWIKASTKY